MNSATSCLTGNTAQNWPWQADHGLLVISNDGPMLLQPCCSCLLACLQSPANPCWAALLLVMTALPGASPPAIGRKASIAPSVTPARYLLPALTARTGPE